MPYDSTLEPPVTTSGPSDVHTSARPSVENTAWLPCYACFDSCGIGSYSSLVIIQLLMHEIWTWENKIADENQAAAESGAGLSQSSQCDTPEKIPHESELLPCHYFDFFYGTAHGGLIATLLGRLRMRVDDAIDHFQDITRAMTSHRPLFPSGLSLRNRTLDRPKYRYKDLVKAVHETVTKHSVKTSECGGTDDNFRTPFALLSLACDSPRQAQTCIVVLAKRPKTIDPRYRKNEMDIFMDREELQLLRTFRLAEARKSHFWKEGRHRERDFLDEDFTDQLDLTICQVLWAAMATPGLLRPFRTSIGKRAVEFSDASSDETNPVNCAFRDYELLQPLRRPWVKPDYVPALFLRIGCTTQCSMATDEQESLWEEIGTQSHFSAAADHRRLPSFRDPGRMCVNSRLKPDLRLDDGVEIGSTESASAFREIYEATIDAVNTDGELRKELRQTAKELVHQRRARQKMGGPRWEVFIGNTVKDNDEDGRSGAAK